MCSVCTRNDLILCNNVYCEAAGGSVARLTVVSAAAAARNPGNGFTPRPSQLFL